MRGKKVWHTHINQAVVWLITVCLSNEVILQIILIVYKTSTHDLIKDSYDREVRIELRYN